MPFDVSYPTSTVNIAGSSMSFSGGSSDGYAVYTKNFFTGVSRVTIEVTNFKSRNLTATLYKKNIGNSNTDTKISTFTFDGNSTSGYSVSNLNTSSKYYLKFSSSPSPTSFKGCIYDL